MVFAPLQTREFALDHQHPSLGRENLAEIYPSPEPNKLILDGAQLQSATMATNPHGHDFRKDSMTNNSDQLSDYDNNAPRWDHKYDIHELAHDHSLSFAPTNPFYTPDALFGSPDTTKHAPASLSQDQPWSYGQTSQKDSPDHFDGADDFDISEYASHGIGHSYSTFTPIQQKQDHMQTAHVQTPISPHSHADWASPTIQEAQCQALKRQMRPSTHARSLSECARPDGIRKKNTRIDIPPERSLIAIEHMLEVSKDEEERKELKSQRRLLRNREAA